MSSVDIQNAIIKVTEIVKSGDIAFIDQAVLESIEDAEYYVQQAVYAKLRQDNRAVMQSLQDAQMNAVISGLQLELPGLEHAALPAMVRDLDAPADKPRMKSVRDASAKEIVSEIKHMRRRVNAQDRVVSGYEATWETIAGLVTITDETTGLEIETSLKAIEAA